MRYIELYNELIKQSFMRAMAYKVNFITVLLTNLTYFMVQLILMDVIFREVDNIAGWTKYEVFFYIGTVAIVDAWWTFGPFFNLHELPELIRNGGFDTYLLKPVNSQFFASLRKIDVGSIMSMLAGIVMAIYAVILGNLKITFLRFIFYIIAIVFALLAEYSLYVILICFAFWFVKADFAEIFHSIICYFANKPADIYSGVIRKVLTTIFSYGFLMTVASKTAISKVSIKEYVYSIFLSAVSFFISIMCWKFSVRKYGSASS